MKRLLFIVLSFYCINIHAAEADTLQITSSIDAVTVYRSGATINRKASAQLPKGISEVKLTKLPAGLDSKSFQVTVSKGFSILSVTPAMEKATLTPSEEMDDLVKKMKDFELKIKLERATQESLKEEEALLMANRQIASSTSGISGAQLEQVTTYFRTRMSSIKTEKVYSEERLAELQLKKDSLRAAQQLIITRQPGESTKSMTLKIMAINGGKVEINIQYFMHNASWVSSFDLRVADITQAMQIDYKSDINNSTGENWDQVQLTLSTGNPVRSNIAPNIQTWWLEYQYYAGQQKASMEDLANVRYRTQIRGEETAESMVPPIADVSENITATEFKLSEKYSIPSGTGSNLILLESKDVPAIYSYTVIPKKNKLAYLTAALTDLETLNLSSGKANIYFGQSYVGETLIDLSAATDTLSISLGADIAIAVSREKVKDKSTKNFFGTKVEETHTWLIKLKNNKARDIQIKIQDQIPVSKAEDIEVKSELSDNAQLDTETGIVTWNQILKSGEAKELRISYKVRYSKGKALNL